MTIDDLKQLKQRFVELANEKGVDAAENEFFAARNSLAPATVALRRALLADLAQDEQGHFFYPDL